MPYLFAFLTFSACLCITLLYVLNRLIECCIYSTVKEVGGEMKAMRVMTLRYKYMDHPFCNDYRLSDSGRSERQTAAVKPCSRYPLQNRALVKIPGVHNVKWLNSKLACLAARLATAISPVAQLLGHGKDKIRMPLKVPFPFLQIAVAGTTHVKQKAFGNAYPLQIANLRSRKCVAAADNSDPSSPPTVDSFSFISRKNLTEVYVEGKGGMSSAHFEG